MARHAESRGVGAPASAIELARRVSGGLEVTLWWSAREGRTSIEVWQGATDETLSFVVPGEHALDAFYHPFAYLPASVDGTVVGFAARGPHADQTRAAA